MLQIPILRPVTTFATGEEQKFNFSFDGIEVIVKNRLLIYPVINQVVSGTACYDKEQTRNNYYHIVSAVDSATSFTSDGWYAAKLVVSSATDSSPTPSSGSWSSVPYLYFYVSLARPTITFTMPTNMQTVGNQTINCTATYLHDTKILSSYRFYLYDNTQTLIKSFELQYTEGKPADVSYVMRQTITNLQNSTLYYIKVKTDSEDGLTGESSYIQFTTDFAVPQATVLGLAQNFPNIGGAKIGLDFIQVKGKVTKNNVVVENPLFDSHEYLHLRQQEDGIEKLHYYNEDGYTTYGDFIIKTWVTAASLSAYPNGGVLCKLSKQATDSSPSESYVMVRKFATYIEAKRFLNGIEVGTVAISNDLPSGVTRYWIYIQSKNQQLGVQVGGD